jgi:nitrogen fixation/metabolism regulation signal transduction histidine kinase
VELAVDEVSLAGEFGACFRHLLLTNPVPPGKRHFLAVLQEASKTMEETRSILQETRGVVNSLAVPAVVIDVKGIIQAFNPYAESLLGFSLVDVVGENVKVNAKLAHESSPLIETAHRKKTTDAHERSRRGKGRAM